MSQAHADMLARHNRNGVSDESLDVPMMTTSPDMKARKTSVQPSEKMYRTTSNVRPKDSSGNNDFLASLGLRALGVPSNSVSPATYHDRSTTMNVDSALLRDNIKTN